MKWALLASLVCCGVPLLLILLGANAGLVLGLLRSNWPVFLLGLVLTAGVIFYVWRYRYKKGTKGRNDLET